MEVVRCGTAPLFQIRREGKELARSVLRSLLEIGGFRDVEVSSENNLIDDTVTSDGASVNCPFVEGTAPSNYSQSLDCELSKPNFVKDS
jgi:hypothetical protein